MTAVLNLGSAVPSSPGYVGTYEWLGVASLGLLDVGHEQALAFTILVHAAWYVPTTLFGAVALGDARGAAAPAARRQSHTTVGVTRHDLSAREALLAALGGVALAIVMSWPLVLHLGSDIGKDLGDPLRPDVAGGLDRPRAPDVAARSLASEHVLAVRRHARVLGRAYRIRARGRARAGQPARCARRLQRALPLRLCPRLRWARTCSRSELGAGWLGAAVAGAAFAYAPWKLTQNGHLHVLSSGGIPLALFLLVRGYRRRSRWTVARGLARRGLADERSASRSASSSSYLLLVLALGASASLSWRRWLRAARSMMSSSRPRPAPRLPRRDDGTHGAPVPSASSTRIPRRERTPAYVETFSPQPPQLPGRARRELALRRRDAPRTRSVARARRDVAVPGLRHRAPRAPRSLSGRCSHAGCASGSSSALSSCALLSLGVRDVDGLGALPHPVPFPLRLRARLGRRPRSGSDQHVDVARAGSARRGGRSACSSARSADALGAARGSPRACSPSPSILVEGLGPLAHPRRASAARCGPRSSPPRSSIFRPASGTTSATATGRRQGFPEDR